jgi:hypothetical protein
MFENIGFVRLGVVPKRAFLLGHEFSESLGDVIDRDHRSLWVEPKVRVLALLLPNAFLFGVQSCREIDQFDPLADVDRLRVDVVVVERLNRAVGPRLEPRTDVEERVSFDDVFRDASVRLPPVAM